MFLDQNFEDINLKPHLYGSIKNKFALKDCDIDIIFETNKEINQNK